MQCPNELVEFFALKIDAAFPFARSNIDLEQGRVDNPADLPFRDPVAAANASHKSRLAKLIWERVCSQVDAGGWQCFARLESQIEVKPLNGKALSRGTPDFYDETLLLFGDLYEDIEFLPVQPMSVDDIALQAIEHFCRTHDPRAYRAEDVRQAIKRETGHDLEYRYVIALMKRLQLDDKWFKRGRRVGKIRPLNVD